MNNVIDELNMEQRNFINTCARMYGTTKSEFLWEHNEALAMAAINNVTIYCQALKDSGIISDYEMDKIIQYVRGN